MLYSKDTYNTNITEKLVELLNDNITGFREMGWISRSKRFGKSIDIKTIKYELCDLVSNANLGTDPNQKMVQTTDSRMKNRLSWKYLFHIYDSGMDDL